MSLITAAQIARVASKATTHVVNAIVDHADDVLPRYGIVTPLRVQHLLAQMFVETGYLRTLEEGLSYTGERLCQVWPKRFRTLASAQPYAHRPEALAQLVYGGRMGNVHPRDAWASRGLGLLQNTGMDGRGRLAKVLHATPDQISAMLTADGWMLECAVADFVALGCLPHADRDDVEGVTRCINGGLTDIAGRRAALPLCREVWTPSAVVPQARATTSITVAPPSTKTRPTASSAHPMTVQIAPMNPQNAAIAALERLAADPHTYEMIGKGVDAAEKGIDST